MNRKVLLVEPNYKNKYPPMGLMKLATYYRESGDDVRFFKGDLLDLAADIVVEDLLNALTTLDAETNWKTDKKILVECVRKGTISLLDEQAHFQNNSDAIELVKNARSSYINIAPSAAETFEIADLGFTALTDEIHHRVALSGVSRLAADLFYSAHAASPPMNGIAP